MMDFKKYGKLREEQFIGALLNNFCQVNADEEGFLMVKEIRKTFQEDYNSERYQ